MKKIIYTLIILIIVGLPLITDAVATDSSDSDTRILYLFYGKEDADFKAIQTWLEEYRRGKKNFNVHYANANDNVEFLTTIRKNLNITDDQLPLFIIGTNYVTGFDNDIKNNLVDIIFAYENSDKYCDVLQAIIKSETQNKINACIEQNKDVYVKEEQENYELKIILIAGIVVIIPVAIIIIIVARNVKKDKKATENKD